MEVARVMSQASDGGGLRDRLKALVNDFSFEISKYGGPDTAGALAQVWMPPEAGAKYLTTQGAPFAIMGVSDELASYRVACGQHTAPADGSNARCPISRVAASLPPMLQPGDLEIDQPVQVCFNRNAHALRCGIQSTLWLPIYDAEDNNDTAAAAAPSSANGADDAEEPPQHPAAVLELAHREADVDFAPATALLQRLALEKALWLPSLNSSSSEELSEEPQHGQAGSSSHDTACQEGNGHQSGGADRRGRRSGRASPSPRGRHSRSLGNCCSRGSRRFRCMEAEPPLPPPPSPPRQAAAPCRGRGGRGLSRILSGRCKPIIVTDYEAAGAVDAAAAAPPAGAAAVATDNVPQHDQHETAAPAAAAAAAGDTAKGDSPLNAAAQSAGVAAATAAAAASQSGERVRVLVTYGGAFCPGSGGGAWTYSGGAQKLVAISRTARFQELATQLTAVGSAPSSGQLPQEQQQQLLQLTALRYALPGEASCTEVLLVDLADDDDLENMWEEYDELRDSTLGVSKDGSSGSTRAQRLRLYVASAQQGASAGGGGGSGGALMQPTTPSHSQLGRHTHSADDGHHHHHHHHQQQAAGAAAAAAAGAAVQPTGGALLAAAGSGDADEYVSAGPPRAGSGVPTSQRGRPTSFAAKRAAVRALVEDLAGRLEMIPPSALTVVRMLGGGAFGEVFLCKWHGSDVAVKCLSPSLIMGSGSRCAPCAEAVAELLREAGTLAALRHPNIVAVFGVVLPPSELLHAGGDGDDADEDGDSGGACTLLAAKMTQRAAPGGHPAAPALVMQYYPVGNLRTALDQRVDWLRGGMVKVKVALDVARGLQYLHSRKVVHFDLKAANVLVSVKDRMPTAALSDFGLTKARRSTYVTGVDSLRGTLPWIAPEIIKEPDAVTEAADVYSFGVVMWEIWTGAEPFQGVSLHALLHHVSSGAGPSLAIPGTQQWEEEHCSDGGDDEVPQEPGPGWGDLMQRCWAHTPQDRPSCDEVQLTLEAMLNTLRSARRPSMDVRPASYSTQTSPLNKPQEAQGHVTAPAARVPQP